jgi:glucose/arabinose dehydrogenase
MKYQQLARSLSVVIILILALATPTQAQPTERTHYDFKFRDMNIRMEVLVTDALAPWAIAVDEDENIFFTELPGRLSVLKNGYKEPRVILTLDFEMFGESGLMGLALHPDFSENGWLYISYSHQIEEENWLTIERLHWAENRLQEDRITIGQIPSARFNIGGSLNFGPDGKLYLSTGDTLKKHLAKDPGSLAGKIIRFNDDGTLPDGETKKSVVKFTPEIVASGFRNLQAFTWLRPSNLLITADNYCEGFNGRNTPDRITSLPPGGFNGWPVTSENGSDAKTLFTFNGHAGPGAMLYYNSNTLPKLSGHLLVSGLRAKGIVAFFVNNEKIIRSEVLIPASFGRIRALAQSPNGFIYFATSNKDGKAFPRPLDDRIFRISITPPDSEDQDDLK